MKNSITKQKGSVFIASIERFGYILQAVGQTKQQAENALLAAYFETYKDTNGINPDEDWVDNSDTYYYLAKREMFTREVEFGKVEWL